MMYKTMLGLPAPGAILVKCCILIERSSLPVEIPAHVIRPTRMHSMPLFPRDWLVIADNDCQVVILSGGPGGDSRFDKMCGLLGSLATAFQQ
jgi:hypothetical protein